MNVFIITASKHVKRGETIKPIDEFMKYPILVGRPS
jgi:hypothetical protein